MLEVAAVYPDAVGQCIFVQCNDEPTQLKLNRAERPWPSADTDILRCSERCKTTVKASSSKVHASMIYEMPCMRRSGSYVHFRPLLPIMVPKLVKLLICCHRWWHWLSCNLWQCPAVGSVEVLDGRLIYILVHQSQASSQGCDSSFSARCSKNLTSFRVPHDVTGCMASLRAMYIR